jgi:hypothetical protein
LVRHLWIHGGERSGGNDIQNLERQRGRSQLVAEKVKWLASRNSRWWLIGDHEALAVALRRENAWDGMRCETAGGDRPGYI